MSIEFPLEELPGFLQGRALNAWLRTDGAGIFTAFQTGVEALDFLENMGVTIPRSTFYTIRAEVLAVIQSSQPLYGYPGNQLIPFQWHETNHGLDLSTEFQYRIHVFGSDPTASVLKDQWMTVASDRVLTSDQVRDVARSYVGEGGVSGDISDYVFAEIEPLRMS